ncbi:hypothetical protein EGT50_07760 [Rhodococcus xishaensis]|uniref:Uncharacterized protein n=1 Tax=Rhodococcus xishaensis TaxID=2487364 RepID=A0A438AVB2_9NOCA|nr:hypothetical protein EGT50_07760 [Rhodococcus xishaensis]
MSLLVEQHPVGRMEHRMPHHAPSVGFLVGSGRAAFLVGEQALKVIRGTLAVCNAVDPYPDNSDVYDTSSGMIR